MAFKKKTWENRISEYPTRRTLAKEDGSTEVVTVAREEGKISKEGDAFSAENMNDLETRIEEAIDELKEMIQKLQESRVTCTQAEYDAM
ncbi:MAG: hypothetical protein NC541_16005, partial [bacterium]|nr:hypothetical protein [bacterium]